MMVFLGGGKLGIFVRVFNPLTAEYGVVCHSGIAAYREINLFVGIWGFHGKRESGASDCMECQ